MDDLEGMKHLKERLQHISSNYRMLISDATGAFSVPAPAPTLMMLARNDAGRLESQTDGGAFVIEVVGVTGLDSATHRLRMTWDSTLQEAKR